LSGLSRLSTARLLNGGSESCKRVELEVVDVFYPTKEIGSREDTDLERISLAGPRTKELGAVVRD